MSLKRQKYVQSSKSHSGLKPDTSANRKKRGEEPTELQNLLNTWFHFDGSMHNFHFYIDRSQQRLMTKLIDSSFNLINYNKYASGFQLLKYL